MSRPRPRAALSARSIALLLGVLLGGCASVMHPMDERRAALIEVPTADGWTVALHHYPPPSGVESRRHAVILCHGIMSNRYTWDLDRRTSLPQWLGARGFDVYALDLRGGGDALEPGLFDEQSYTYTFDDYVRFDVPAAIEAVSARSGGRPVHWVGHSMGGMVMYAWLQHGDQRRVRSFTAVGSPPRMARHVDWFTDAFALLPLAEALFDEVPAGTASTLASPWAEEQAVAPLHLLWNYDNMHPRSARALAAHGTANLSVGVLRQLADSAMSGRLQSADGQIDYTEGLAQIAIPTLMIAGVLDHLCPPSVMMAGFSRLGSPVKALAVMGRAWGAKADFGHLDLAMGVAAPDDVFPRVLDWLVTHD